MKIVKIAIEEMEQRTIELGQQDDGEVLSVEFDATAWMMECPDGMLAGMVQSPGGESYPIQLDMRGAAALWTVRKSDTTEAGRGRIQLKLLGPRGEEWHSAVAWTLIRPSLRIQGGASPPDPMKPWTDALEKARTAAENAAKRADDEAHKLSQIRAEAKPLPPGSPPTAIMNHHAAEKVLELGIPAGEQGLPGFSPDVTVSKTETGHRVTITDADGTETFDVEDGLNSGLEAMTIQDLEEIMS